MATSSPSTSSDASTQPTTPNKDEDELPEADIKIILLGDSAVGKSKLVERYLMDDYVPRQLSTFALTVFRHEAEVKDANGEKKKVKIDFWDTAGQERFNSMHPSYYHRANACILIFDVSRKVTYKNLENWHKELLSYRKYVPVICVANKIDVNMEVTNKQFAFPTKRKLPFFFCSAADGTNVVDVFESAIAAAYKNKVNPEKQSFVDQCLETLDYLELNAKKRAEEAGKDKSTEQKT